MALIRVCHWTPRSKGLHSAAGVLGWRCVHSSASQPALERPGTMARVSAHGTPEQEAPFSRARQPSSRDAALTSPKVTRDPGPLPASSAGATSGVGAPLPWRRPLGPRSVPARPRPLTRCPLRGGAGVRNHAAGRRRWGPGPRASLCPGVAMPGRAHAAEDGVASRGPSIAPGWCRPGGVGAPGPGQRHLSQRGSRSVVPRRPP